MRQLVEATIFPKRRVPAAGRLYRICFLLRAAGMAVTISNSERTSTDLIYDAQFARQPISFLRLGQIPADSSDTCLTNVP